MIATAPFVATTHCVHYTGRTQLERTMSLRTSSLFAAAFALVAIACDKKAETPPPTTANTPPPTANTPPPAVNTPPPAAKVDTGFVIYATVLKREGSDKPKVDDGKGKQVANWLATLYRGEKVTLGAEEGDYIKAKTSGDIEGFVKKSSLLIAPDVTEATVLEPTDGFDRPELLAVNSKKKINAGALLYVVKTKEQFSEVNASGSSTTWILSGKLSTDATEISVAKLLAKARSLKDSKKGEGAQDLVNLAKSNFASAKLVTIMETELAAPAPAAEGEAAAAATADAAKPEEKK